MCIHKALECHLSGRENEIITTTKKKTRNFVCNPNGIKFPHVYQKEMHCMQYNNNNKCFAETAHIYIQTFTHICAYVCIINALLCGGMQPVQTKSDFLTFVQQVYNVSWKEFPKCLENKRFQCIIPFVDTPAASTGATIDLQRRV